MSKLHAVCGTINFLVNFIFETKFLKFRLEVNQENYLKTVFLTFRKSRNVLEMKVK